MKKFFALSLALLLVLGCFGCNLFKGEEEESETEIVDTYNDWTSEALYEAAKEEGGKVWIYSTTKDIAKVVELFQEAYPEIDIESLEVDTDEIAQKITTEAETGNVTADVVLVKDSTGEIYRDLVLAHTLTIYRPTDICELIDDDLLKYGLPCFSSFSPWFYNTEMFPDGPGIESWWDIVQGYDEETRSYKDGQYWTIYSKDITSPSYIALWSQLIVDGDEIAAQYEKQYGKELVYTYMDDLANDEFMEFPENNGGVELFYRFTKMTITELEDGDAVVEAVHNSLNGPTIGLTSASKLKLRDENGYNIAWVTQLAPYTAFQNVSSLYVSTGCDNPAAARLFIRFCMDAENGGYSKLDKMGAWSVLEGVTFQKSEVTVEDIGLTAPDFNAIYDIYPSAKQYWVYWRGLND